MATQPGNFPEQPQFPLNTVGPKGQQAFVGVHKLFFTGLTGAVATATSPGAAGIGPGQFGIPGILATRVATGVYDVFHPKSKSLDVIPSLDCPTGTQARINIQRPQDGRSGVFRFLVTRDPITGSAVIGTNAPVAFNPVTGTVANLLFFVAPVTPF